MNQSEIREWVARNNEVGLDDEEIGHVAMCLDHIQRWYFEGYPLGDFLTAIVKNDFCKACFLADDTNGKAVKIYALFLHNHMPTGWRKKGR